jgi:hypothetical protein
MLAFEKLKRQEISFAELVAGVDAKALAQLTEEMLDAQVAMLEGCEDADVFFEPSDPDAYDPYTENSAEENMPWSLGHLIVHVTASSEESAFLAAEMARGVPYERRRSRSEVPWRTVKTMAQCRKRLAESRRMRLASLSMWPDEPHLNISYDTPRGTKIDAVGRFILGLWHDYQHLEQIQDVVRQAKAARATDGGE